MKKKSFLLYIGLFVIVCSNILTRYVNGLDEIWIYNFARCILNGLLPYKDFSIIVTPLFPYICAVFLKIFGNEMIVLRICGVFEITTILFMMYKILTRLKVNKNFALLGVIAIYFEYADTFCFDYNFTVLLIVLIILYIELKYSKERLKFDFKKDLGLGILCGLTITLKQTTGLIFSLVFIFYKIFEISKNKEAIKKYIKIVLTRALGVIIPVLILVIYLLCNNIWDDFIDYAIKRCFNFFK